MNFLGGIIQTGIDGFITLEQSKAAADLAASNAQISAQNLTATLQAKRFELIVIGGVALVGVLALMGRK